MPSPNLDYHLNTYLAVTLTPNSPYLTSPEALSTIHPSLVHVGRVGEMSDVQLLSVPKEDWEQEGEREKVLDRLRGQEGVSRVDVQELRQRAKRGGDEL